VLLESLLEKSAQQFPDQEAVVAGEHRLTYGQVEQLANRVAHGLRHAGVKPGDRVGIFLDNQWESIVSIFAVLKIGAAFTMLHPSTKSKRLLYKLQDSEATALLFPAQKWPVVKKIVGTNTHLKALVCVGALPKDIPESGELRWLTWNDLAQGEGTTTPPEKRHIDLDLAGLLYTSGSTGNPKGVMLSHGNICSVIQSIVSYTGVGNSDRVMVVLPLSFGYGLTQLFSSFAVGACVVIEKSMAYPHVTLTRMTEERITSLSIVPTIAAVLLERDLSNYDLSHLRWMTNAGDALPIEFINKLRSALPEVRLFCMYGQTECMRISYLEPDDLLRKLGSVGKGIPNQELYLIDEDGNTPATGEVGELVVRGSHVMKGYLNLPELTNAKLFPGKLPGERVLHTGDLFRQDEEGYLFFVSRMDDIIKSKGEKVSPREVEEVLLRMPGVANAAVVGVADPLFGQAVKAVIVPENGVELNPKHVQGFCAQQLEDYMVPKIVEFRTELPKTTTGKVLRRELQSPKLLILMVIISLFQLTAIAVLEGGAHDPHGIKMGWPPKEPRFWVRPRKRIHKE
jgi:long-chain acyl-CoA synthetase